MNKHPKQWIKPELTILIRSNPEESVLMTCKESGGATPGSGAGLSASGCFIFMVGCDPCSDTADS